MIDEFQSNYVGNVYIDDCDELVKQISDAFEVPALLRLDGSLYVFRQDMSALFDVQIAPYDTLIHRYHGSMTPFAALASSQGVLPSGGMMFFGDSHLDNNRANSETEQAIEAFDDCPNKDNFDALVNYTTYDLQQFVDVLRRYFGSILTCYRPPDTLHFDQYGPMPISEYVHDDFRPRSSYTRADYEGKTIVRPYVKLATLIRQFRDQISFYNFDADMIGVLSDEGIEDCKLRECDDDLGLCDLLMDEVILGLKELLPDAVGWSPDLPAPLFSISVDEVWVYDPYTFLRRFIDEFHKHIPRDI